ncbi:MAG: hypothetical protein L3J20_10115 [Flavobacteriaceae bacterium]|nr:hypothetical protein [Flavobacteriaceae bacterium]
MRKILLALSAVLVLASFTNNTDKTIILKDIDGTLLQSFPIIKQVNNEYTITFTVDAMTVVTSNVDTDGTHINLIDNGNSGTTVTHTLTFDRGAIDFNSYILSNTDVASSSEMYLATYIEKKEKPRGLILE